MPKPLASGGGVTSAFLNDLVGVYDRSTATVDISASTTETAIYSKSIGAGHLATDRMLRLTLVGDYLNSTGAGSNFTVRCKFGATTLYTLGPFSPALGARRTHSIILVVANKGATNSQIAQLWSNNMQNLGAVDDRVMVEQVAVTAAEDTTAAKTLEVTVQHGTSSASISARKLYAVLELQ